VKPVGYGRFPKFMEASYQGCENVSSTFHKKNIFFDQSLPVTPCRAARRDVGSTGSPPDCRRDTPSSKSLRWFDKLTNHRLSDECREKFFFTYLTSSTSRLKVLLFKKTPRDALWIHIPETGMLSSGGMELWKA
jgi:hypothetical protein